MSFARLLKPALEMLRNTVSMLAGTQNYCKVEGSVQVLVCNLNS